MKLPVCDIFFKSVIAIVLWSTIFLSSSVPAYSQSDPIDSMQQVLQQTKKPIDRFNIYFELVRYNFQFENFTDALTYANQAFEIAVDINDSLRMVKAIRAKGILLGRLHDLDESLKSYTYALGISKRNGYDDQTIFLLNVIANAYAFQANYDKALEYHFQGLVLREEKGSDEEVSVANNNIGFVYFKLNNYEQALKYFKKAEFYCKRTAEKIGLEECLVNIGLCYNGLDRPEDAISNFNEALELCKDSCDANILTEGHFGLGIAYIVTGDLEKAKQQFKISHAKGLKANNIVVLTENLFQLHIISVEQGELDSAFYYLSKAEQMITNANYNKLKIELFKYFAKYYILTEEFQKASEYQRRYIQLKDSIFSSELINNIASVQTKFEERENEAIIASNQLVLDRQKRFIWAVAIIAMLSASLVFVLYRSNQTKKRVNRALSEAKGTIEDQNKQLTTLNRNLEKMVDSRTMELQVANESLKRVNDELDNFIYKTSHDIRGPLASLRGICNVAILDVKDGLALDYFDKLDATAEKLNTILTRLLIINQINSSSSGKELIDFKEIVEEVIVLERKRGLPTNLRISSQVEEGILFYSDKELVRIILENLIDNAIKFYNDSDRVSPFVRIAVVKENKRIKVSVIDNGIGVREVNPDKIFQIFSRASERSGTGGIGLYLTKTATEKIGGRIDLRTTAEGFTEFCVEFSMSSSRLRTQVTV